MNEYDEELQAYLEVAILKKEVEVRDNVETIFNLIERNFTNYVASIAWNTTSLIWNKASDESLLQDVLKTINEKFALSTVHFNVVGDNLTDFTYRMPFPL